jgi:hypothetical protein
LLFLSSCDYTRGHCRIIIEEIVLNAGITERI